MDASRIRSLVPLLGGSTLVGAPFVTAVVVQPDRTTLLHDLFWAGPVPLLCFLLGSVGVVYGTARLTRGPSRALSPGTVAAVPVLVVLLVEAFQGAPDPPPIDPTFGPPPPSRPPTFWEQVPSGLAGQTVAVGWLVVAGTAVATDRPFWAAGALAASLAFVVAASPAAPLGSLLLVAVVGVPVVALGWTLGRPRQAG